MVSSLRSISSVSVRGVLSRCHPHLVRRLGYLVLSSVSPRVVGTSRASHQMKGKQARRRGRAGRPRVLVSSSCPVLRAAGVPFPVLMAFPSCPSSPRPHPRQASKGGKRKRDKGKTRGSGERRRHGGLDNRIHGSYPDEQMRISKQDENGKRPRPISIISRPTGHISCPINQSPSPTTSKTRRRNNGRRRAGKTNTETTRRTTKRKCTGHARRQASNETQYETHDETTTTRKSKQYEAVIGRREEQTAPFSHLSPDPLSSALPHPSASIVPPPPGVGRADGEAGLPRSPSHPLPRRVPSLTPSPHPLSLAAYPHPTASSLRTRRSR